MSGLTQQKTHPIQSDFASAIFFHSYESSTSNFDLSGSGSDEHGIFTSNSCGVPGTCKYTALRNCENVTLNNCSDCNPAASGLFGFLVVTIGFFILLGNSLILAVAARFYKKRTATKIDLLKVSLAIADLLTGKSIKLKLLVACQDTSFIFPKQCNVIYDAIMSGEYIVSDGILSPNKF